MPEGERRNIVLIMVDDADRKALEWGAATRIRAALRDQGATATRYLINHPQCAPSRASILRGRYSQNTGVDNNNNAYNKFRNFGGDTDNVAVWLQESGYRTALIGKYLNGYPVKKDEPALPPEPGWDYWFTAGKDAYNSYNYPVNDNGTYDYYGSDEGTDYFTDVLRRKALEFLDTVGAEQPFMMVVTPMAPHSPAIPHAQYDELYSDAEYPKGAANPSFNEQDVTDKPFYVSKLDELLPQQIANIDTRFRRKLQSMESVADLVDAVIAKLAEVPGRLDDTYVFFTSDNGFHMGEHRLGKDDLQDEDPVPTPGGKNTMYEEDIRVPLWVRGPGIAQGSTVEELLGNVDLAPTFRAIAGLAPDPDIDGRSFLPLLQGQSTPWRTQYLISRGRNKSYAGIRAAEWVFTELDDPQPTEIIGEYYNLSEDPADPDADHPQLRNRYLALTGAERADLRAKVAAYRVCAGESCRVADSA